MTKPGQTDLRGADLASQVAQARLKGALEIEDAAKLSARRGSKITLELRDRAGQRILLEEPVVVSWADVGIRPGLPTLVVSVDACLSIIPQDTLDPGVARNQRADLTKKVRKQITGNEAKKRLRREQIAIRDEQIVRDLAAGMLVKDVAKKYKVSPTTVCKARADSAKKEGA